MKNQKSNDLNIHVSPHAENAERGDGVSSPSLIPSESASHDDEASAEPTSECANRRDRRCRKILDTIG